MAVFSSRSPLFRLASALFAAAALVGALKFFSGYVDDQVHKLISLLAGVAGFPAMASSIALSEQRATRHWSSSVLILAVFAAMGVVVVIGTGVRTYLNAVALISTLSVGFSCWRQRHWQGVVSAAVILLGLVCFAAKLPVSTVLQPADVLHLALAAGWLGLSIRWESRARR